MLPLAPALALAGCGWSGSVPKRQAQPHYVLGTAYQAGGVWYYPSQSFNAEETGLAAIQPDRHPALTADGETFDQTVLAGAHQTLQLPCIVRLTNLENGRAITLRLNDRGPASPARAVAVTRRAATLLGFVGAGVARVRLTVLGGPSRAVATALRGEVADRLDIASAPRGAVEQVDLPPPAGVTQAASAPHAFSVPFASAAESLQPVLENVPDRLPETVTQSAPEPGSLYVRMGVFSRREFAERQRARAAGLGAAIEASRVGRSETFLVRIGPIDDVAEADRVLRQVIRDGIPDARIVVE